MTNLNASSKYTVRSWPMSVKNDGYSYKTDCFHSLSKTVSSLGLQETSHNVLSDASLKIAMDKKIVGFRLSPSVDLTEDRINISFIQSTDTTRKKHHAVEITMDATALRFRHTIEDSDFSRHTLEFSPWKVTGSYSYGGCGNHMFTKPPFTGIALQYNKAKNDWAFLILVNDTVYDDVKDMFSTTYNHSQEVRMPIGLIKDSQWKSIKRKLENGTIKPADVFIDSPESYYIKEAKEEEIPENHRPIFLTDHRTPEQKESDKLSSYCNNYNIGEGDTAKKIYKELSPASKEKADRFRKGEAV